MDKFIVAVFPDESSAYDGLRRLKSLHEARSIALYGWAVLKKDADGKVSVKETGDQDVGNTVIGALTGGLVGVLGGPVGALMGLSVGALAGSFGDLRDLDIEEAFLDQVSDQLKPGRSAVVAEIFETWVTPLDVEIEAAGGTVLRQTRLGFEDEKAAREADARRKELERLRDEWARASAERKAKLQASIDKAQANLDAAADRLDKRMAQADKDAERRIRAMEAQVAGAAEDTRRDIEQRIANTRADLNARNAKLTLAAKLAREALAPAAAHPEPA
jgi:uncharacterized membrane protein